MANKHVKDGHREFSLREQTTITRNHFPPRRMAVRQTVASVGEGEEKPDSRFAGGNVKWCSHFGKRFGGSLKTLSIQLPQDLAIPPRPPPGTARDKREHAPPQTRRVNVRGGQLAGSGNTPVPAHRGVDDLGGLPVRRDGVRPQKGTRH